MMGQFKPGHKLGMHDRGHHNKPGHGPKRHKPKLGPKHHAAGPGHHHKHKGKDLSFANAHAMKHGVGHQFQGRNGLQGLIGQLASVLRK